MAQPPPFRFLNTRRWPQQATCSSRVHPTTVGSQVRGTEAPSYSIDFTLDWGILRYRLPCRRVWNRGRSKTQFPIQGHLAGKSLRACVCCMCGWCMFVFGETAALWIVTTFEEVTVLRWRSSSKDRKYNTALLVQMHPNKVDLKRSYFYNPTEIVLLNHKSFFFFNFLALKWHKGCRVDQPLFFFS